MVVFHSWAFMFLPTREQVKIESMGMSFQREIVTDGLKQKSKL